jgi:hypothetical protein
MVPEFSRLYCEAPRRSPGLSGPHPVFFVAVLADAVVVSNGVNKDAGSTMMLKDR